MGGVIPFTLLQPNDLENRTLFLQFPVTPTLGALLELVAFTFQDLPSTVSNVLPHHTTANGHANVMGDGVINDLHSKRQVGLGPFYGGSP